MPQAQRLKRNPEKDDIHWTKGDASASRSRDFSINAGQANTRRNIFNQYVIRAYRLRLRF